MKSLLPLIKFDWEQMRILRHCEVRQHITNAVVLLILLIACVSSSGPASVSL